MDSSLDQNKHSAIDFYEIAFNNCKPEEAVNKYVGNDYIQHNPQVQSGKDGFIKYFQRMAAEYPQKKLIIKRAIAEGCYVVLHCYQEWPGSGNFATIDIFRFDDNNKIVEHWDVIQAIPQNALNPMF